MNYISVLIKALEIEKTNVNQIKKNFKSIISVLNEAVCENEEEEVMISEHKEMVDKKIESSNSYIKAIEKKINDLRLKQLEG